MSDAAAVAAPPIDNVKAVKKNKRRGQRGPKKCGDGQGLPPYYKVIVRKLPTRDFDHSRFEECLRRVCDQLTGADEVASVTVQTLMEGTHTREHGNLPGAGFLIFSDALLVKEFLSRVPLQVPFLQQDEFNLQPEVGFALYQKRAREQNDSNKFSSQFATDPEFIAWKAQEDATKPHQAITGAPKPDPKDSALLSFLRERALRRIAEKKGGRAKSTMTEVDKMTKGSSSKGRPKGGKEKVAGDKKADPDRKDKKRRGSKSAGATQALSTAPPPEALVGVNPDLKDNITKSLAAFREQQGGEASSGRRGRRGKGGGGEGSTHPQIKLVSKGEALPPQR